MEKTAHCVCGQFRVIVTGPPRNVTACHCHACQRWSGVPWTSNAFYARSDVRLEASYKVHVREGQEGRRIRQHFCPDCGSTLFSVGEKFPGICMVVAGAFADPDFPPPTASDFEELKHAWATLTDWIEHYPQGRAPRALRADG